MATNNANNESNPISVSQGGQGNATLTTAYGVLCGGTSSTSPVQTLSSLGTATWVLASGGAGVLPAFAATTGGSNVTLGNISTNWYPSGSTFGGTSTTSNKTRSTGTLYYHPIFINKSLTFTKIGIVCSSTVAGTSVLGLYNDNGSSKPSGNPIANSNSGNITNTLNTFITFTFGSAITLSAGIYWTAHSTSGTTTFVGTTSGGLDIGGRGLGINGTPTSSLIAAPQVGWSQSFTYSSTLPSVGTLTATNGGTGIGDIFVFLQAQ